MKVFIDGRAQAAYDFDHYSDYREVVDKFIKDIMQADMFRWEVTQTSSLQTFEKKKLKAEIKKIMVKLGYYVPELSRRGVTAVLFDYNKILFNVFAFSDDWEFVYADKKSMLFLNINAPDAVKGLKENAGQLVFPTAGPKYSG